MDKIELALKLAKDCTYADTMMFEAKVHLRDAIDQALKEYQPKQMSVTDEGEIEVIWDKHSEDIGTDIDSLQFFAGKTVMIRAEFIKAMKGLMHQPSEKWISMKDNQPKELETVWAIDIKNNFVMLGCLVYEDGWLWAKSNDTMYIEKGKIVCECESDDDYNITHWMPIPNPPQVKPNPKTS